MNILELLIESVLVGFSAVFVLNLARFVVRNPGKVKQAVMYLVNLPEQPRAETKSTVDYILKVVLVFFVTVGVFAIIGGVV